MGSQPAWTWPRVCERLSRLKSEAEYLQDACSSHGGNIEIDTRLGQGTRLVFRFRRPVVDAAAVKGRRERRWRLLTDVAGEQVAAKALPSTKPRQLA